MFSPYANGVPKYQPLVRTRQAQPLRGSGSKGPATIKTVRGAHRLHDDRLGTKDFDIQSTAFIAEASTLDADVQRLSRRMPDAPSHLAVTVPKQESKICGGSICPRRALY